MEWFGIVALLLLLCYSAYPGKVKRLETKVKRLEKKQRGVAYMSKLINDLVGKQCIIRSEFIFSFAGKTELSCKIIDADDEWIKICYGRRNTKMTMSDPIADMLTRIRNANTAKHDTVDVPSSKMKLAIADILLEEGYIKKYDLIDEGNFKTIRITLKYGADRNDKIISGLKRISKPGLRIYAGKDELPRVLGGLGIAIISTNQGVVTDKKARELQVGGEVLAYIW